MRVDSGSPWIDRDIENAKFDDVRVYDSALTAKEVNTVYQGKEIETAKSSAPTGPDKPSTDKPSTDKPSTDKPADKPSADVKEPAKVTETPKNVGTAVTATEGSFKVIDATAGAAEVASTVKIKK